GPPRLQTLPKDLGLALLYGRQTDREARLELRAVLAGELDQVRTVLSNIAGPYLGEEIQRQQAAKVSRTQDLLSMRRRLPDDTSMAALRQIRSEHMEDALLDRWPQLPLGYLDGKTPEEAARLDEYRIRIRAAIMIVESWIEFQADRLDLNRLRERLGLSLPGPIDPEQTDVEKLPVVRWPRVQLEKLSDERLVNLLHFAVLCKAVQAIEHFGRAIIERPSLEGNAERLSAYNFLAAVNSSNDRAIEYIDRGRKEAEALGQSSASWDLQELRCRFARFDTEEVGRLLNHIESQHIREPGVRESLIRFLMQVGVIRPDGTRVGRARPDADSPPAAVATAEPAEEPGRLWTPESQRPAGEKPKIWMPGMD
ncbi:MAG: hypothetical protein HUU20_14580, partial [Pirellulales bacterium]|nr:hypothetical protein [Pirellulales bacterium]